MLIIDFEFLKVFVQPRVHDFFNYFVTATQKIYGTIVVKILLTIRFIYWQSFSIFKRLWKYTSLSDRLIRYVTFGARSKQLLISNILLISSMPQE